MASGTRDGNIKAETFEIFFLGWLSRQEYYLALLLAAQQHIDEENELRALISRVLEHYQQYYEQKSKIAEDNILLCFSPTWMSSLERAFLWIGGFKPGLTFKILVKAVHDLSEEQISRIQRLGQETKVEERALNEEYAKVQESVAAPPLIEKVKHHGRVRLVDGEIPTGLASMDTLKVEMENVLTDADLLRTTTATKLMEILRPQQTVKLLAAAAQLHIKIRAWGMEKDGRSQSMQFHMQR